MFVHNNINKEKNMIKYNAHDVALYLLAILSWITMTAWLFWILAELAGLV